jgi:hypothetical protein
MLKITQFFKDLLERIDNFNALVAEIASGLGKVPGFEGRPLQERGTKMWIEESTSAYIRENLGRSRLRKVALKRSRLLELGRFAKIVSWIIGNKALRTQFLEYMLRVEHMLIRNGSTYTFKYMKECLRLTVRALAGTPEVGTSYQPGDIRVRRDKFGIPTMLQLPLRLILHSFILNAEQPRFVPDEYADLDPRAYPWATEVEGPKWSQRNIVGVLTLMSVFRVFSTKVDATLGTIVKPFDGFSRTLESEHLHKAICNLSAKTETREVFDFDTGGTKTITKVTAGKPLKLSVGRFSPHISVKAGPNGPLATWGAAIDALAFLHEPRKLFSLIVWMDRQNAHNWIYLLVSILLIFGPIYGFFYGIQSAFGFVSSLLAPYPKLYYTIIVPLKWIFSWIRISTGSGVFERDKLYLGKLGVVYDQAGKARVVASANWWIQSALRGLHDSIFKFLKTIPQDGTMDQDAAFALVIKNHAKGHLLSGFDLSAATDRLPIDLQIQILELCGIDGSTWSELMRVTYCSPFSNLENLGEVEYAVGQPMGAYSSWAMLALSHHVIIQYSAILAGHKGYINYAVLGDDGLINNDPIAHAYVEVMKLLGLQISMGKSVVSTRFTEFAKKLRGPGIDFSPIGAGAVLSACRSGMMLPQLFLAAIGNVITSPEEILDRLRDFPTGLVNRSQAAGYLSVVLWQLFGPSSPFAKKSVNFGSLIGSVLEFVPDIPQKGYIFEHVKDSLGNLFMKRIRNQIALSHTPMMYFLMKALPLVVSKSPVMRILEFLMKPFNPGFWIYFWSAFTATHKLNTFLDEHYASYPGYDMDPYWRAKAILEKLSKASPELSVLSLDLTKRQQAERAKFLIDLRKDMKARFELSEQFAWPRGLHTRWYELSDFH